MPEADNQTQTDAFLDRPPTPIFVPQKSGVDVTTQIENGGWMAVHACDSRACAAPILSIANAHMRGMHYACKDWHLNPPPFKMQLV